MTLPNLPKSAAALAGALALALALPTAAESPAVKTGVPEVGPFEIAPLNEGKTAYYGRFGSTNCAWIDMGDGVLVVDTGGSETDATNLKAQIKATTKGKPVKWIVMTHLHGDSNDGLKSFLPTDATIFVNVQVASGVAAGVLTASKGAKAPTVIGVVDRALISAGGHLVEVGVPGGAAHTDHDLYAFWTESGGVLFAGDLVTSGRCPMMSDPKCDPKGWLAALDRIEAHHPGFLVPTRGDETKLPNNEIGATRNYIKRILEVLVEMKKQNAPEAKVAGQLRLKPVGDYCPAELDVINALAVYKRIGKDGSVTAPRPAAAPKKTK